MVENLVKKKLGEGREIICAFLRIPEASVAEVMAEAGIDMLVIDQEHYLFSEKDMLQIIRAADYYGCSCLIRMAQVDRERIGRLLDGGAAGILLSDAADSAQIRKLIEAVKYPPCGNRGVSTDSRNNRYGRANRNLTGFARMQNRNTIIGVIIETKSAIADLDEILKIPEIDILSVGTMDLTYAYGVPGQTRNEKVQQLKRNIYKKIIAAGKVALDKAFTKEEMEAARKNGVRCLCVASDLGLIDTGLNRILN